MLDAALHIGELSRRQPRIVKRLGKYSFLEVASILSGLLTQPATHAATLRIEGLIHLAALHCSGHQAPPLANFREWLNDILMRDLLGSGEDPPEDVFVTITPSWTGPARLFEGKWTENSYHLQTMLAALLRFPRDGWVQSALVHVMPLLRLSEEIARRSGVPRYTLATSEPQAPIRVAPNNVQRGQACVSFTADDLAKLHIDERALLPFAFTPERANRLADEELGNTTLERLPLLHHSAGWLVILPTALSAAARLFIVDLAQQNGQIEQLSAAIRDVELQEVMTVGIAGWKLRNPSDIRHYPGGVSAFTAEFDVGGYAAVVYLTGDLGAVFASGLQGVDSPQAAFDKTVFPLQQELAGRDDYRRGLTIVLLGGVGRGFTLGFPEPPPEWQQVAMSMADALRLGWDHDFTAIRAWKLRTHEDQMVARGYQIINVNGFLNHYGFLESQGFLPVPPELGSPGLMTLSPGHVTAVRSRIRKALDYHLLADPTHSRWIEVQRRSTAPFFQEISDLPLFVAPGEFFGGRLLAAVETEARTWWIGTPRDAQDPMARDLVGKVWDAAQRWMVRLAPELERDLDTLPSGPIGIELEFPDVELVASRMGAEHGAATRPDVRVDDHGSVRVASSLEVLRAHSDPVNTAERWLIAAMALGAAKLAQADRNEAWADALAMLITRADDARFVHAIPAATPTQALQFYAPLPPARLVKDEDIGWAMFGLAAASGCPGPASVSPTDAGPLLRTTVLRLWERIRPTLGRLNRKSVVVRALLNQEAIDKDRVEWRHTAAALLALHDQADVVETHNDREYQRGVAGIASRAIAEMAICTSPVTGGLPITDVDFDQLLADVAAMVESASQCDAYYYELTSEPLNVAANGSFQFDRQFLDRIQRPFNDAQGERLFRDAAADYAEAFAKAATDPDAVAPPMIDPLLVAAMQDEFGLGFEDLFNVCQEFAEDALEAGQPYLSLRRSEVLGRLSAEERNGRVDAERAYKALTLLPRARWDEEKPVGARARDWQPWRMNRKLSLTRRPLIQVDEGEDPEVLLFPVLMDRVVRRVLELVDGRLPAEMFDTAAIHQWIGTVVNDRGHAFNHRVAEVLQSVGFEAAPDQMMTRFGADRSFGDADVLAWKAATGEVWVIECKRLQIDRTVAEIGERFLDYTVTGKKTGKRTAIQKHLDRVEYLQKNPALVARHTRIEPARLVVRSALVTDRIVPMQFTERMTPLVDRVSDFRNLRTDFE
ncbi:hypothetical protein [Mesorhizobium sp. WSM2561]|uniref:hypothetical protein n=1 Tax=Mesorhizobium sp. WSM2561 TaxID=1040985 RepID=UPI000482C491|nr:hypothetical protein [Mesorhizobium sp. WSM2561]